MNDSGTENDLIQQVKCLKLPPSSKVLPPLTAVVDEVADDDNWSEFQFECKKYGLISRKDKEWYAKLIENIYQIAEDISTVWSWKVITRTKDLRVVLWIINGSLFLMSTELIQAGQ